MFEKPVKKVKSQRGATAIEYGLIAGLIAVAILATVMRTGNLTSNVFNMASNGLSTASR